MPLTAAEAYAGALARIFSPSTKQGKAMNWDQAEGNWKQLKGKIKVQWGKITDDELDQIAGRRDQLVGRVQERYGMQKAEAEKRVTEWERHN